MVMGGLPEGCSLSGRVPELLLRRLRSEKRRWRTNSRFSAAINFFSRVSVPRGLYRRKEGSGGHPGQPGGSLPRPPWAAPGTLLGAWWWASSSGLAFPEGSVEEKLILIFLEFFGQFNPSENLKYKNSRKQELATGCTELVG